MSETEKKYCEYCGRKLSEFVNEDAKKEHVAHCGTKTEQKVIKG